MAYSGIGFNAKRLSGKSWSARYLLSAYPNYFQGIWSFADPLREMYAQVIGVDPAVLKDPKTKELYRPGMIAWADVQRSINPDVFVNRWKDTVPKDGAWICDDIRRRNELAAVVALNGNPMRIDCNIGLRIKRGYVFTPGVDDHPTECDLDEIALFQEPAHKVKNQETDNYNKAALDAAVQRSIIGGMHFSC